ncbi:transposase family protein [Treponema sp. OMZ 305]|uniref:transposase family protein n=1 Tax=Treponema sp. OMZ 305 TaxID=1659192 RepID=UPI002206E016|nr:transposase family protein [Treponema sp. OMZ 305]
MSAWSIKLSSRIKEQKGKERTKDEIEFNGEISRQRIAIEHTSRYLKRFRILGSRYRNKRRKFALRITLIYGIYNLRHWFSNMSNVRELQPSAKLPLLSIYLNIQTDKEEFLGISKNSVRFLEMPDEF